MSPAVKSLVMAVPNSSALGGFIADLRRSLKIRQIDVAHRAGVSRQWLVALEQGKPTLELGLVLRTLETLGLELTLHPSSALPPWIIKRAQDAQAHHTALQARRRARRKTRRETERLNRLAANAPRVGVDLE